MRAVATEAWTPNVRVAHERLGLLDCPVVQAAGRYPPFCDGSFDLVLCRHDAIDMREIARILRPHGVLLTQQVYRTWPEITEYLPRRTDFGDHFTDYQAAARESGLDVIDARSEVPRIAFDDLGDLVYLLCIAPWTVPEFDPLDRNLDALLALEADLRTNDGIMLTDGRYILEATKLA